jgi:hypothetical protein
MRERVKKTIKTLLELQVDDRSGLAKLQEGNADKQYEIVVQQTCECGQAERS